MMAIAAAGLAFARLVWQPPVLGYLAAGLLIGPFTLPHPVISNLDTIELMAELGLVLLLFGIGLELGWRRIREIGFLVLVIGIVEITTLTLLGVLIANKVLGISGASGLYLGGAMAISSSAILLKGLRDTGNLRSSWGQTIVGILLVEDFAAVILLTLLAGIATTGSANLGDVSWLVAKLAIFSIGALAFGTLLAPRLMRLLSRTRSDETLLLASLGCCFGLALGAQFLGLSAAAGSFLIGVVIGDTDAAGRVTRLVSPVRDMFGALFFMSIGMLIDYRTLDDFILPALMIVAVFMAGKMIANTIGSILSGRNSRQAVQVGMSMPQMGEFSLAIGRLSAADAVAGPIIGPILAIVTAITSVLAPLTSRLARPICDWTSRRAPPTLVEMDLGDSAGHQDFLVGVFAAGSHGPSAEKPGAPDINQHTDYRNPDGHGNDSGVHAAGISRRDSAGVPGFAGADFRRGDHRVEHPAGHCHLAGTADTGAPGGWRGQMGQIRGIGAFYAANADAGRNGYRNAAGGGDGADAADYPAVRAGFALGASADTAAGHIRRAAGVGGVSHSPRARDGVSRSLRCAHRAAESVTAVGRRAG